MALQFYLFSNSCIDYIHWFFNGYCEAGNSYHIYEHYFDESIKERKQIIEEKLVKVFVWSKY